LRTYLNKSMFNKFNLKTLMNKENKLKVQLLKFKLSWMKKEMLLNN